VSTSKVLVVVIGTIALAGCKKQRDKSEDIVLPSATCLSCQAASEVGALASSEMDEISGVVASSKRDDVYFVHNDSGDRARFFAIDGHGARLATFVFSKTDVVDCEDIARGPCPGGSCLFIGDIGDNGRSRGEIVVYRVREPDVIADATIPSDPLPFGYPDGPHNAETLFVHPKTGVLTIVTKERSGPSSIFEAPLPFTPGVKATLKKAGSLQAPIGNPLFTAGSVHPDATGVLLRTLLRTYTHAFYAPMRPEQTVADALRVPLCSLPILHEEQGEAIAWQRDGKGFVTISEGVGAKVNATRCGP
jgi:hypothetical protein